MSSTKDGFKPEFPQTYHFAENAAANPAICSLHDCLRFSILAYLLYKLRHMQLALSNPSNFNQYCQEGFKS